MTIAAILKTVLIASACSFAAVGHHNNTPGMPGTGGSVADTCQVLIPNAFSDADDGIVQPFCPRSNCPFEFYDLTVYNRWGSQVFKSDKKQPCWDGTSDNKKCPEGIYMYTFKYKFSGQEKDTITGTVNLLR